MIRAMKASDLEEVMELWFQGNRGAHGFIDPSYWERRRGAVKQAIAGADVLVFEENGRIEGFVGLTGPYIAGLFVSGGCRRRGVGTNLLRSCQEKYSTLALHVYEKNENAVQFYQARGFIAREKGRNPETGEPEWRMEWNREKKEKEANVD